MFGSPIFVPDYILSAGLHFICTVATSADDCLVQRIIISASKLPYIHHSCQVSLCEKEFHRIFRRKHNCRFCGRVVCGECSQIKIHDNRVCNDCFHTNEGFLHTGGDDNDRAPHSQQSPHRLSSFQSQFYDNGNHGGGNQPLKASRISVKGRLSPYPVSARGVGMAMHTITEEQSPARSTDAQNSHGQTQLMLAASQGNLTRVRYLIEDIGKYRELALLCAL